MHGEQCISNIRILLNKKDIDGFDKINKIILSLSILIWKSKSVEWNKFIQKTYPFQKFFSQTISFSRILRKKTIFHRSFAYPWIEFQIQKKEKNFIISIIASTHSIPESKFSNSSRRWPSGRSLSIHGEAPWMRNERESCEETEDTGFCAAREWESKVTSATPRSFFLLTENSSHQTANHLMLAIVFPSGNVSVMSFLRYRFNVSDLS